MSGGSLPCNSYCDKAECKQSTITAKCHGTKSTVQPRVMDRRKISRNIVVRSGLGARENTPAPCSPCWQKFRRLLRSSGREWCWSTRSEIRSRSQIFHHIFWLFFDHQGRRASSKQGLPKHICRC